MLSRWFSAGSGESSGGATIELCSCRGATSIANATWIEIETLIAASETLIETCAILICASVDRQLLPSHFSKVPVEQFVLLSVSSRGLRTATLDLS
jgi:hypothetical protein